MVVQLAVNLLGDRDEALDLSQEVFLRVFRTIHRFRGQSSLRTWIYRIAVNQARNRHRFWRRRHRADQVSFDAHVAAHGEFASSRHWTPERLLAQKELAARLHAALNHLPFDQRTVDRASRGRRPELRGHCVLTRRGDRHGQVAADARPAGAAPGTAGRGEIMTLALMRGGARAAAGVLRRRAARLRQIAVSSHLDRCESCAAALADLESLGSMLRAAAPGHVPLPCDEADAHVDDRQPREGGRRRVADDASAGLFDDRHILYAGLGAAAATVACLVIMLGMMRFGTSERSDSLAGMLNVLSVPGPDEHPLVIRPIVLDARVMMPMALDSTFSSGDFGDQVLALSGVVTTRGAPRQPRGARRNLHRRCADGHDDAKRYESSSTPCRARDSNRVMKGAARSPSIWSGLSRTPPFADASTFAAACTRRSPANSVA